jgi:hypothetical protein
MTRVIEVVVDPQGATTVQTKGFAGDSCGEASRLIEQALGQRLEERRTTEFYGVSELQHTQQRA